MRRPLSESLPSLRGSSKGQDRFDGLGEGLSLRPGGLVKAGPVVRPDAQGVEWFGPGGVDDFEPFQASVLGEARWDGIEVPQAESGEVGCVPVTDIAAVQVALAWVDAARLPVGDDGAGGPVERARGLPPVQQMLASVCAGDYALGEDAAFDGDGVAAYGVGERF